MFTHDTPWAVDVHEQFRFHLRPLVAELEAIIDFSKNCKFSHMDEDIILKIGTHIL